MMGIRELGDQMDIQVNKEAPVTLETLETREDWGNE